jgi:hypothetical protein
MQLHLVFDVQAFFCGRCSTGVEETSRLLGVSGSRCAVGIEAGDVLRFRGKSCCGQRVREQHWKR